MKQKMRLNAIMDFYKTSDIKHGTDGYELTDKKSGVVFVLPRRFQVFIDGDFLDPIRFLKVPPYLYSLVFDDKIVPLEATYLCGEYKLFGENEEELKFYPSDPMDDELTEKAVLLKLTWDIRESIDDSAWKEAFGSLYGGSLIWSARDSDSYETVGTWYILLDPKLDVHHFGNAGVCVLLTNYVRTLRPVYRLSDEVSEKFNREKPKYKAKIWEIVAPYKDKSNWKVISHTDCTVLKYDDTVGKVTVFSYRHDGIGYTDCVNEFGKTEA